MTNSQNEFDNQKNRITFDSQDTALDNTPSSLVSDESEAGTSMAQDRDEEQSNHGSSAAPDQSEIVENKDDNRNHDDNELALKKIEEEKSFHQNRTDVIEEETDLGSSIQDQAVPAVDHHRHYESIDKSTPNQNSNADQVKSNLPDPAQEAREAYSHNHKDSEPSPHHAPSPTRKYVAHYDEPRTDFNNTLPFLSMVLAFLIPVLGGVFGIFTYFLTDKRNTVGRVLSLVSIAYTTAAFIILIFATIIFFTTLAPVF